MTALLEIDLAAVAWNWRKLAAMHAGATAGVIKADAYGLGAAQVAPKLLAAGCRHFFLAHLAEAVALRPLLPGVMLAALNGLRPEETGDCYAQGIVPVLGSLHELGWWRAEAALRGAVLPVILQVDTGMARLGLSAQELAVLREDAALLQGLRVEYVLTHLTSAEKPRAPVNQRQAQAFAGIMRQFPGVKTSFANTSGMFLGADFASGLARPGAGLYGLNPTPAAANPMRPVVRLSAPILQIHEVMTGGAVGYGGTWVARRPSRIATVGVGYADGYLRALSNAGTARFDDTPVPLVGRVSMDLTTFDVTGLPVSPGDMLCLLGAGHGPDELAREAGTTGYEILTSLGRRYRRRYIGA
ncbi:alanine racemase [Acidocella sp.]|uniref:alanine racemase n=1 Tax=Acidocella sp. TaxID=50710 RepID=UPI0017AE60B8|nr:alanine racemase [Acidocella sp.]NNM55609.1 alanine racemase [Acidocella sp.]